MTDFILSTTSSADLSIEELYKEDIKWIGYPYQLDNKEYIDDLGKTISLDQFYQRMTEGASVSTSQITYVRYIDYFEDLLKYEKDILHLCLSSGITGEYQQALMAKKELEEKYPERKILVLDSLTGTTGQGLLILEMNKLRKEGKSIEEVYDWAVNNRLKINAMIFTTDLTYLVRGGRLSKAAGSFGNLLNICPIIEFNINGVLVVKDKIRTKKKAMKALIDIIKNDRIEDIENINRIYVIHTHAYEDALELQKMLRKKLGDFDGEIKIAEIGTTIGSHLGPGSIGLAFWSKTRNTQG